MLWKEDMINEAHFTMQMIAQHPEIMVYRERLGLPEDKFIFLIEQIANVNAMSQSEVGLTEMQVVDAVLLLCAKVIEWRK